MLSFLVSFLLVLFDLSFYLLRPVRSSCSTFTSFHLHFVFPFLSSQFVFSKFLGKETVLIAHALILSLLSSPSKNQLWIAKTIKKRPKKPNVQELNLIKPAFIASQKKKAKELKSKHSPLSLTRAWRRFISPVAPSTPTWPWNPSDRICKIRQGDRQKGAVHMVGAMDIFAVRGEENHRLSKKRGWELRRN